MVRHTHLTDTGVINFFFLGTPSPIIQRRETDICENVISKFININSEGFTSCMLHFTYVLKLKY